MGKFILLLVLAIILGIASACSPVQASSASLLPDAGISDSAILNRSTSEDDVGSSSRSQSSSDTSKMSREMAEFEGQVFVATTDLVEELWESSGWAISNQPLDTDTQDLPEDCTLHPHSGVKDQWVGSCSGYVLIPRSGAKHIAVMLTSLDGSTTMVQIAPPPDRP